MDGLKPRLLAEIDPAAIARDTLDFVRVVSETGTEGPGSHFLAMLLQRQGWPVTVDEFLPNRPNVLAHRPGVGGGRSLLFNGHTDTIPIGNSRPPGREGAWIWGRGAEDMKGGLVAMVHAVRAIERAGLRLRGDLWLSGVVGHETPVGKKEGPHRLIAQLRANQPRADAILIVEGPAAIWCASLGSAVFTVRLRAEREPIHTIKVPFKENPVRSLATLLRALDDLDARLAALPGHELAGKDQVNVGIVKAGDYFNRLPVEITVTGTRRWGPGRTEAAIHDELLALATTVASAHGLRGEVVLEGTREPFETPADHPLVQALGRAGETILGRPVERVGMGLVGDANLYVNDGGVPTVYFGPAHETAHSDLERVSVTRLSELAAIYALTAVDYCGLA